MLDNGKLAWTAAKFKAETSRDFDKAVKELVALAYKYARFGADFLWDLDPELDREANRILRELSDNLAQKARELARSIVEDELDEFDFAEAWDREDGNGLTILPRLDMEGSHLKELLEIWVAIAFVHNLTKGELRVMVSRYLANPFASTLWKGLPRDVLAWGRGYSLNIMEQMAVIGQNAIISSSRYAEWMDAVAKGAKSYIRRRGSTYHCPECDSLCGFPIPIEVPFEYVHSRCMCYPEYQTGV